MALTLVAGAGLIGIGNNGEVKSVFLGSLSIKFKGFVGLGTGLGFVVG